MKISVVMITKNPNTIWIHQAIESFYNQSYHNKELIIIDASNEINRGLIKRIISYFDNLGIIKFNIQNSVGLWPAFEEGMKIASGEVVGVLNSDDYFHDINVLDKIATSIISENADYIYGKSLRVDQAGVPLYLHKPPIFLYKFNIDFYVFVISHHAFYFKKAILDSIPFEISIGDIPPDLFFIRNIFKSEYKGVRLNLIIANFRIHQNNFSKSYSYLGAKKLFEKLNGVPSIFFIFAKLLTILQNPSYLVYLLKNRLI